MLLLSLLLHPSPSPLMMIQVVPKLALGWRQQPVPQLYSDGSSASSVLPSGMDVLYSSAKGNASIFSLDASQDFKHRVVWTEEEDRLLGELIRKHGTNKWSVIASKIPSKSNKHCRRRWQARLNAVGNKGMWTPQEDAKLLEGHRLFGNRWTEIASLVPGRTDNAAKNRYMALTKKEGSSAASDSGISAGGLASPVGAREVASRALAGVKRSRPACASEPPAGSNKKPAKLVDLLAREARCSSGSETSEVVQEGEEWAESAHPQTPAARTWIDLNSVPHMQHREL